MPFSTEQLAVANNVLAIARKYRSVCGVPELAHLAVTYQESGWSEGAVNPADPSGSFGPYQQNGQAWPPAPYIGPDPWFDYGFGRDGAGGWSGWRDAWAAHGQGWETPSLRTTVLQNFAPAAQGSVSWSVDIAERAYSAAFEMLELLS
jgi:hypothetical protein